MTKGMIMCDFINNCLPSIFENKDLFTESIKSLSLGAECINSSTINLCFLNNLINDPEYQI